MLSKTIDEPLRESLLRDNSLTRRVIQVTNPASPSLRSVCRGQASALCSLRVEKDTETESPVPLDDLKSVRNGNEGAEKLQVKIQAFEEKIAADSSPPGSARRYSLGQVSKEERKEMRFNRYGSAAGVRALLLPTRL